MAYSKIANPWPKSPETVRAAMPVWEKELSYFQSELSWTVDEDAKILSFKTLMLEVMFGDGGVFEGWLEMSHRGQVCAEHLTYSCQC